MPKSDFETSASRFTFIGATLVTCLVLSRVSTDPVNVPKFFVLGGLAFGLFGYLIFNTARRLLRNERLLIGAIGIFLLSLVNSLIGKSAPFSQLIYGAYGRNTGFLTYLFLGLILMSVSTFRTQRSIKMILFSFFVSAAINIFYCAWVLSFGDFIGWNNPSGNLLGLFGNPDFISAFLGMSISGIAAYIFAKETKISIKVLLCFIAGLALFQIVHTKAIQGLVVTVVGVAIVLFFYLRSRLNSKPILISYILVMGFMGLLAILGTLQKGPLNFLYKRSVSLRGTYWKTGVEMGIMNPANGVGLDTYGDWYRRARPPIALLDTPGPAITSNVSHNVVIDFFAAGGVPLLISYLAVVLVILLAVGRSLLKTRKYDPILVSMVSIWVCYEIQSLISINQIGLAIWGWLLGGGLVAYSRILEIEYSDHKPLTSTRAGKSFNTAGSNILSPNLGIGIGLLAGLLIAVPPLNSDTKWFTAINSTSVVEVEKALQSSYMTPQNSFRYMQAVNLFSTNNLPKLALKYAEIGVNFNPDSFEVWRQLYGLQNASEPQRKQALQNMKRLDPLNPDVTKP